MLISIAAGLVLGTALAFFQNYSDDSIKSAEEVTWLLGLPSLGVIPRLGSIRRGAGYYKLAYGQPKEGQETSPDTASAIPKFELVSDAAPSSVLGEAYRSIRTSLLLSTPDHAPRTILITSAVPSEGKTSTAVNVAISLSQTGARGLLIDCDMRKPRIHSILGLEATTLGLPAFLTGAASLKDVVHETRLQNLYAIPCGVVPPNPGELLVSARFREMLNVLVQYFRSEEHTS